MVEGSSVLMTQGAMLSGVGGLWRFVDQTTELQASEK